MTIPISDLFRAYRLELRLGLFVTAVIAAFGLQKFLNLRFAAKAAKWPSVRSRIENVFLDVGNNRRDIPHAVLAYSYAIGDSYYSGEIRLWAGGQNVEDLEKTIIGQPISIQYNPQHPEISIFLKHKVRGWDVVKDERLSVWSWLDDLF